MSLNILQFDASGCSMFVDETVLSRVNVVRTNV